MAVIAVIGGTPIAVLALWIAVNRVEWLGPFVADGLRSVIGAENVTSIEDFGYSVQDKVFRFTRRGQKPKAYRAVPETSARPQPNPSPDQNGSDASPVLPPFQPKAAGPVHESWSAPGDGQWVGIQDPKRPKEEPRLYKTLLHPDKNRSWAELFVVAIDLRRADIHMVAGRYEPQAREEEAKEIERPGTIPETHRTNVLAAFNGGFKTEHGRYGMFLGGLTFVKARKGVCTLVKYKDGRMRLASWGKVKDQQADMLWWRQTPNCMYEDGKVNSRLESGNTRKWGATLDGETVIRRSAIGLSPDNDTLYIGISNHTTAPAIALGMHHVGAPTVAQLDVNFSYPKFVVFSKNAKTEERLALPLADGFEFSDGEFIRDRARRDFFYIMPAKGERRTAQK